MWICFFNSSFLYIGEQHNILSGMHIQLHVPSIKKIMHGIYDNLHDLELVDICQILVCMNSKMMKVWVSGTLSYLYVQKRAVLRQTGALIDKIIYSFPCSYHTAPTYSAAC